MDYRRLGRTGLQVSALTLGCMSFGEPGRGRQQWTLDEDASRDIIKTALEAGVTTFDTANVYSAGSSEEIVGRALADFARRDEIVLASKVHGRMRPGPNGAGLSRAAIMTEVEHSLRRLRTDYLDLYQIHRWDYDTPIEETLSALDDLVRAGKVRYLGASSMFAWQFAQALAVSERHGWARFDSMQNHLNLLYREEEREMMALCLHEGIGVIPWSPLARGRLARAPDAPATDRANTDGFQRTLYDATQAADARVIDAVGTVAAQRGLPRAQVALAWVLARPGVAAPIVGASKPHHLADAVAALSITLTDDENRQLEEHYVPHAVAGF